MKYKIGFIGIGNMGGALLHAVCEKIGGVGNAVADMDTAKTSAASSEYGCTVSNAAEIAAEAEYIFLGVKPQMMAGLLTEIAPILKNRTDRFVLVTMAAGLTMAQISSMVPHKPSASRS